MVKLILVKKNGTINCRNVNINSLDNIYKKCGFTNNKTFAKRHTWNKDGDFYSLYAKINGKAGSENKYECPPPVDDVLFFGTLAFVKHSESEISLETLKSLEKEEFETVEEHLFGGFEDLDDTEEESEEEDVDSDDLTKEGYCKDGFVVDDDDEEDESDFEDICDEVEYDDDEVI